MLAGCGSDSQIDQIITLMIIALPQLNTAIESNRLISMGPFEYSDVVTADLTIPMVFNLEQVPPQPV